MIMNRNNWIEPEKLKQLVFGIHVPMRELLVFDSKEQAMATVEGLSIAEGDWRFFSSDGSALEACFSVQARIHPDRNTYSNGIYTLEAAPGAPGLLSFLATVECKDLA
jgi:hypothetical protein